MTRQPDQRPRAIVQSLYVAGPMTGYPMMNYPAFHGATYELRELGFIVYNPVDVDQEKRYPTDHMTWQWYMRRTLRMLLLAEGVATLPRAELSRGARVEISIARILEMPVHPVNEWIVLGEHRANRERLGEGK